MELLAANGALSATTTFATFHSMLDIYHIDHDSLNLEGIRTLFRAYTVELGEDLCFQGFTEELDAPLKKYGPPNGDLLLAYWYNDEAGCVALQPLDPEESVCEMKRLYVKPEYREHGIGDNLVQMILQSAIEKGYKKMVLDTLDRLKPAIHMYLKHGFTICSPYYSNPLPNVVYMEKLLVD